MDHMDLYQKLLFISCWAFTINSMLSSSFFFRNVTQSFPGYYKGVKLVKAIIIVSLVSMNN